MSWSERFAEHISSQGLKQVDVALQLRGYGVFASMSQVHYWIHGSEPRQETQKAIERWSRGRVPAEPKSEPARKRPSSAPG